MPRKPGPALALDLGRSTGWACDGQHGTRSFSGDRAKVFHDMDLWLSDMVTHHEPYLIVFERPFMRGATTRVHFGLAALVELVAYRRSLFVGEVSPSTIKKHATGSGRADKAAMIAAAAARGWNPATDHEADALWLLDYVVTNRESN